MSPLPDRRTLESMRRADLQKLCKDRGLKANMKTESLIDLLIETSKPEPSTQHHKRSSSMRIVSRPPSSSGARNRVGSMVIHDTDDDAEPEADAEGQPMDTDPPLHDGMSSHPSQIPAPAPVPATRTRMGADGQRRLGLGRPKALGGSGLRAPPRMASTSQMNRVKAGKSVRPAEVPIQEEDEQTPQAGPSGTSHDPPTNRSSPLTDLSSQTPSDPKAKASQPSSDVIAPLLVKLEETQAEVRRLASSTVDMDSIRTAMTELTIEVAALRSQSARQTELEAQVRALREEIAALRIPISADSSRTRMASGAERATSSGAHGQLEAAAFPASSSEDFSTHSSLGKRHRVTGDLDIVDVIEEEDADGLGENALQAQIPRHPRKKAKLAERERSNEGVAHSVHRDYDVDVDMPAIPPVQRGPSFTVFSGPEEPPEPLSNGPPTTGLSDIFPTTTTPPNGTTPSVPTSSAHGAENQLPSTGNNAFTFSFANSVFQPATSTPLANLTMPAPEPPTSPSPAYVERAGGRRERNDPFHPSGRPHSRTSRPASRNARASSSTPTLQAGEATASPAALLRAPPLPTVAEETRSSTPGQIATSSGASTTTHGGLLPRTGSLMMPGLVPLPVAPDTPAAPPTKRTMYGTELEMDTRFGDFGVEGVATMGFRWGAAPRY